MGNFKKVSLFFKVSKPALFNSKNNINILTPKKI